MNTINFLGGPKKGGEQESPLFAPPADGSIDPWNESPQLAVPMQWPISINVLDDKVVLEFPAADWEKAEHGITTHAVVIWPENLTRLSNALLAAKQRFDRENFIQPKGDEA